MHNTLSFDDAHTWAKSIVAQMTLEEKCDYIGGTDYFYTKAIERLGIPRVLFSDASAGVVLRDQFIDTTYQNPLDKATAFPAPILLASTWNMDLVENYSSSVARQCRANGIGVLLGPGLNMYRISQCGRNFEYLGEDPYLIGSIVERYVQGVQKNGVISTLKHFVANNTDYFRRKSNSVVDERTLHEIYLPGFKAGIEAGAKAVMTSYNLVNGEWAGQSEAVIHKLLRKKLGFQWLVMTDWWSVFDGVKMVESGQDIEMPGLLAAQDILEKIQNKEVDVAHIDRMVTSLLTTFKAMGSFELEPAPMTKHDFKKHEQVALETAREGIVLLRNENNALPLKDSDDDILLLGNFITKKAVGQGSSFVKGYNQLTQLDVFNTHLAGRTHYESNPSDESIKNAKRIILSIGTDDGESWDRPFALSEFYEPFVNKVLSLNPNVILLVNSGSGIRMSDWFDKAAAIVYCWYNGQNGNVALAEILKGEVNPSGKLPITIEKDFSDSPGAAYVPEGEALYYAENNAWEAARDVYDVQYSEGVFVGYRWYESKNIEPLYPFGFGLSYTEFAYSNFQLSCSSLKSGEALTLSFDIANQGGRQGKEIAQVYVKDLESSVARPLKELKGFSKIALDAGEKSAVQIELKPSAFQFWDESTSEWKLEPGEFEILVGSSSKDIHLSARVSIS